MPGVFALNAADRLGVNIRVPNIWSFRVGPDWDNDSKVLLMAVCFGLYRARILSFDG